VDQAITFGPVPSRRLGRSLGINNVPAKTCTYSCVYCQLGPTKGRTAEPCSFWTPDDIRESVQRRLSATGAGDVVADYLTFVPDGEPTLDANIGESIRALRPLGIPVAVITNGSLLWRDAVRDALGAADWVSVKVDSVDEKTWRRINRPWAGLPFDAVLDGIRQFASAYRGELATETMLVAGVNDDAKSIDRIGHFVAAIDPAVAYLAVPTRPPAVATVRGPDEEALTACYERLRAHVPHVEYLIGEEGDAFASTGDPEADLLAITAVHPMRESSVEELLRRAGAERSVVEDMVVSGALKVVTYAGTRFYVRPLSGASRD
jgi:wyosine [tRNA(Phe)-imidazoG37] synthetase (radical SAM superfamily)